MKSGTGRVVLDTAVVLRALLLSDSQAKRLRAAWQSGQCQVLIGRTTAQALIKALAFPAFQLDAAQQQELLADFLPYAEVVAERDGAASAMLALVDAAAALDWVVSDCAKLRATWSRKRLACELLSTDEFLARLG
jgi:predicted nucleic acid-binding protein